MKEVYIIMIKCRVQEHYNLEKARGRALRSLKGVSYS